MAFALRDVMHAKNASDALQRLTAYPEVFGYNVVISSLFERIAMNVEAVLEQTAVRHYSLRY